MAIIQSHSPQILWQNDGSTAFTIVSGNVYWWTPAQTLVSNFSIAPTYWHEISTTGCDYLKIQWQSQLIDKGGITAVTTDTLSFAAQGMWHVDPVDTDLSKPHCTRATVGAAGDHGTPEFSPFPIMVDKMSWGAASAQGRTFNITAEGGTDHASGTFFVMGNSASRVPVVLTDYPGYNAWLHVRNAHNTHGATDPTNTEYHDIPARISGIDKVWLAVSCFLSWTGTSPTTFKTKGKLVALKYRHSDRS